MKKEEIGMCGKSTRHHRGSKNYALFFLNKRCLWGLKKRLDILFSADHLVLF